MGPRYRLHTVIQRELDNLGRQIVRLPGGARLPTLQVAAGAQPLPLPRCFDEIAASLRALPRSLFEPDGSFIVSGPIGEWQLAGQLTEQGDLVSYVALWGSIDPGMFDRVLEAFGWPEIRLIFQLVPEGVYVDEGSFRRYACTP